VTAKKADTVTAKKADTVTAKKTDMVAKKADNNGSTNAVNSAPATKKPPATGKGGSKKALNSKDPKQGNLLSFFKKV
ncbi:DNA polymerase delta subunit, partial [Trifolium medium]|nr:DNA polymerase delta subunit [Trifolium medium]